MLYHCIVKMQVCVLLAWLLFLCSNAEGRLNYLFSSTCMKYPLSADMRGKQFRDFDKDVHLLANLPQDSSSSFETFLPKSMHKRLPRSLSLLLKGFNLVRKKECADVRPPLESTVTTMSRVKLLFPFLDHLWIKTILQKVSPIGGILLQWIRNNKSKFLLGGKIFAGLYFALTIIRRIIHWYTGVAEYELLLDEHDFDYQTYGIHMDSFGAWILSRIDKSHVENFGYTELFYRIETAMNKPCFPYAMNTYALYMGNELSEMVNSLDVKLRAIRKQHHLARKEYQHLQQQLSTLSSKRENKLLRSQEMKLMSNLQCLRQESDITFVLQRTLLILSVRQADAYLRTTRMLILAEANNCEDLLKSWQDTVAKQSQTLRIPLFQTLIAKLLGFTTASRTFSTQQVFSENRRVLSTESSPIANNSVHAFSKAADKHNTHELYSTNLVIKDLNAKEKVVLLENILKNLYVVTGRIQRHLESLQPLAHLLTRPNDDVLRKGDVWRQLEWWVTQSSTLTLEAVHVLSFQPAMLAAKAAAFSSFASDKQSSGSSRYALSSSGWEMKPVISPALKYYETPINENISSTQNVNQEHPMSKDTPMSVTMTLPSSELMLSLNDSTMHQIVTENKMKTLSIHRRRKPLGLSTKTLSLLCLLSSSMMNMDSSIVQSFMPVLEFLVPMPPKELIEKGVITSSPWQKSIEYSGGKNIVIRPWHHLYPPSSEVNHTHSSNRCFAIREMLFQQGSQNQTPLSSLWEKSSLVQLLNLIPQQSTTQNSLLSRENQKTYMMTTFQQFFTTIPVATTTAVDGDSSFVKEITANTCNTTTCWMFTPASDVDVVALKQTLEFPPSVSVPTTSFVSNWLLPVKNKRSHSRNQGQWTKVSVSMNVQVHSTLYKYVIASLARTEMENFVNCWRKILADGLIQQGWMLKVASSDYRQEESTHEDILQLKMLLQNNLLPNLNDRTPLHFLDNVAASIQSNITSKIANSTFEINREKPLIPSSDATSQTKDSYIDRSIATNFESSSYRTGKQFWERKKRSSFVTLGSLLHRLDSTLTLQEELVISLSNSWQTSGVILKDLTRVSQNFANQLHSMGLKKRMHQGIYAILRFRVLVTLTFWTSLALAGFELNKRSEDISWGADFLWQTFKRFIKRRIATPTLSIVNDVILNKRMKITDAGALTDAKRSLRTMLYDFLQQHNPNLSESERQQLATNMDMRPISEEYENQLKHPMRNIVTGSIARLVLIQLQFLKKELLVAMQAIDELFNANQVNLQLLAVSPAILAIFALQVMGRLVTSLVKASTKGKGNMMESASNVYRDVKLHLRDIERILINSDAYREVRFGRHSPLTASVGTNASSYDSTAPHLPDLTPAEWGQLLSVLYRVHLLIMIHSGNFEAHNLQQLQEDLRDVTRPYLSVQQRLSVLERMHRHYTFLQAPRRIFGGGFMQ